MPSPFLFPLFVMHGACVPFVILRLTGTKIKRRLKKYSYSLKKKKKSCCFRITFKWMVILGGYCNFEEI